MHFTVCATDGDYGRLADVKTVIYVNGLERYPDKRLLAGVRSFAEEKGLEFKVEVDPSVPAQLYGDEIRIKQILVNLMVV